ncbi:hypothetical protein D1007_17312 [Hordeum vulgare]|nr:hypothetical protein D1007_17312 [Hordeum vulgare]
MSVLRSRASAPVDPKDAHLTSVLRRSLTTAETDVRRLLHKNAKALRLVMEVSEREVNKEEATKTKVARHAKEQECLLAGFRA